MDVAGSPGGTVVYAPVLDDVLTPLIPTSVATLGVVPTPAKPATGVTTLGVAKASTVSAGWWQALLSSPTRGEAPVGRAAKRVKPK